MSYRARFIIKMIVWGVLAVWAQIKAYSSIGSIENAPMFIFIFCCFLVWLFIFLLQTVLVRVVVLGCPLKWNSWRIFGALGMLFFVYAAACSIVFWGSPFLPLVLMQSQLLSPFNVGMGYVYCVYFLLSTLFILCMFASVLLYGGSSYECMVSVKTLKVLRHGQNNKILVLGGGVGVLGALLSIATGRGMGVLYMVYAWLIFYTLLLIFPLTLRFILAGKPIISWIYKLLFFFGAYCLSYCISSYSAVVSVSGFFIIAPGLSMLLRAHSMKLWGAYLFMDGCLVLLLGLLYRLYSGILSYGSEIDGENG